MTFLDTSTAIDFLLGDGVAGEVGALLEYEGVLAAPDLLVFEVLAVLRREVQRGELAGARADGAVEDIGDLPVDLFPGLPLRARAWELRQNLTVADAIFAALAERLGEPLVTKDRGLAAAARAHAGIEVVLLPE
ncbi:MAG: type II toxin-antitoxin system VapC family toxin [Solirubrobacteraceae bacterium]